MSFGAAIGASAVGGVLNNAIGNINGYNLWQAQNPASAFFDPLGFGFGKILQGSEKLANKKSFKQAQKYAELQYQYALRSAREMPLATRQGLESAGYNALLALGSTGGGSSAYHLPQAPNFENYGSYKAGMLEHLAGLSVAGAQQENISANTLRTKVNTYSDVVKSLLGLATGAAIFKRLGNNTPTSAKGVISAKSSSAKSASSNVPSVGSSAMSLVPLAKGSAVSAATTAAVYGYQKLMSYLTKDIEATVPKASDSRMRGRTGTMTGRQYKPSNRKHN